MEPRTGRRNPVNIATRGGVTAAVARNAPPLSAQRGGHVQDLWTPGSVIPSGFGHPGLRSKVPSGLSDRAKTFFHTFSVVSSFFLLPLLLRAPVHDHLPRLTGSHDLEGLLVLRVVEAMRDNRGDVGPR